MEKHLIVRRSLLHTTSIKGFEYEKILIFLDKLHGTIVGCLETSDLGILSERIFIITTTPRDHREVGLQVAQISPAKEIAYHQMNQLKRLR